MANLLVLRVPTCGYILVVQHLAENTRKVGSNRDRPLAHASLPAILQKHAQRQKLPLGEEFSKLVGTEQHAPSTPLRISANFLPRQTERHVTKDGTQPFG